MNNMMDSITGGYKSSAKVAGGTLVLSLPDALTPVVWRMDLGTAKTSAIEVRENEDGHYDLVLKTPKADAHKIATYEFKIKATQALMAVTKAMSKAEYQKEVGIDEDGQKRYLPVPVKPKMTPLRWIWRILKYILTLIAVLAVILLAYTLYQISVGVKQGVNPANVAQQYDQHKKIMENRQKTGEVLSADDFLRKK